jgi:predicted amino acid dehydrogenase
MPRAHVQAGGGVQHAGSFAYLLHRRDAVLANPPGTAPSHRQAVNAGADSAAACVLFSNFAIDGPGATRWTGEVVLAGLPASHPIDLAAEIASLDQGLQLARERGAQHIGLSATAACLTSGGLDLVRDDCCLSSGLALRTSAMAGVLDGAMDRLARNWSSQTAAVLGANTQLGRAATGLLAERVSRLVLIGEPPVGEVHGRAALLAVAAEACARLARGRGRGPLAVQVRELLGRTASLSALAMAPVVERMVQIGAIVLTTDRQRFRQATVGVLASVGDTALTPAMLRTASVVCDMHSPPRIPRELADSRPDLLVLDAGRFERRTDAAPSGLLGSRGLPPALVEALVLCADGSREHSGLGGRIESAEVSRLMARASAFGFELSPLSSYGERVPAAQWELLRKLRVFPGAA